MPQALERTPRRSRKKLRLPAVEIKLLMAGR